MCWGDNWTGQLGNGEFTDQTAPVQVYGLTNGVVALSGGGAFTCALMEMGGVKCWGDNQFGQLGDATNNASAFPVDVIGI
jgi:alpha-tubulin suppressor-like RCC1 family protein